MSSEERKFKPGDRVRCIQPISKCGALYNLDPNIIYTVDFYEKSPVSMGFNIFLRGKVAIYDARRFELINLPRNYNAKTISNTTTTNNTRM